MAASNNRTKKTASKKTASAVRKKTAASARGKAAGRKRSSAAANKDTGIAREAAVLIILALSIIFFIANFGVGGMVGAAISSFFFGLFGLAAYIFPILLFGGVIFMISNRGNRAAKVKFIAGIAVMILVCTLIQLISGSHADEWKFTQYYTECSLNKNGGGFFGGSLCKLFVTWFGTVGAYLIDIVLIIIGIVVISERSFIGGVKKSGKKVYDTARYDMYRHREHQKEHEANKKITIKNEPHEKVELTRAAKKVYGVTFDTEIKDTAPPEEVHEIKPSGRTKKNVRDKEPVFHFEPAASRQSEAEDDNILDFEAAHYTEEQSSPFDVFEGEEEYIPFESETETGTDDNAQDEYVRAETEYSKQAFADEPKENHPYETQTRQDAGVYEEVKDDHVKTSQKNTYGSSGTENIAVPKPAEKRRKYVFPPLNLLKRSAGKRSGTDSAELKNTAMKLQQTLANFGVKVTVTDVSCGPAVTRYEIQPEQGVKVSKIVSLADDIKLNLAAADIRIEAPIPGKAAVGIEVPNKENSVVMLGDLIASAEFKKHPSAIAFAAGKDIGGKTVLADIAKMPHLLIAGATGSGKSVCINTIIMSIIYKAHPDDVKLIMVDPKVVELSVYNGIPHLMIPVVTDPKKAAGALNWAVAEMSDRYQKFAKYGVRDIKGYNEKVESIENVDDENKPVKLPQIVIIVDELADLMMVSSNEVEDAIVRLAQLARAAGIHLVIATQRPSVNVITGLIKANVPSRIAFSVSSGVDSRTIIDMNGAEKLLGKGDMLFYPQGYQKPARVQGAFVSDEEVSAVVEFLKEHGDAVEYNENVANSISNPGFEESKAFGGDKDQYFAEAGRFIIEKERASIGMLQRVYKIGFNRAARIMDQLCEAGVVGPEEGTKPRKVLMTMEEFNSYLNS